MSEGPVVQIGGAGFRALVGAAAMVVVIAGLDAAQDILLPILFAGFLSILATPVMRALQRLGVPTPVAIALVVVAVAGSLLGITAIFGSTVRSFTAQIPQYEGPLQALVERTLAQLGNAGVAAPELGDLSELLQPSTVMALVGQTLNAVVGVLSRIVIVTLTMTFILFETSELHRKMQLAFGEGGDVEASFGQAPLQVQRYLFIKSAVSLTTGLLVGGWCWALGLDFAVMWGLIAFLLNYIPSIGSILAAIPPILLAIVQLGWVSAGMVGLGYIATNLFLGNFLEPRLLGRTLGLSPLVVFLSLLFWGWLWGPAGMLFCVPLTVIAKLIMEGNDDTRWIAIFLGSTRDARGLQSRSEAPKA